jgi:hypothetical protein
MGERLELQIIIFVAAVETEAFAAFKPILARRYVKFGFGGAHTDSNQRLMYTSA